MINSVNALEFLKPKLITMDKFNSTTTTKLLPPSSLTQSRSFSTMDFLQEKQTQFLLNDKVKPQDRVKVQHLENHKNLQNNKCWNNFRTLYNISASSSDVKDREICKISQTKDDNEKDVVNAETTTTTPLHIQNKSAFNLDLNDMKYHYSNNSVGGINTKNYNNIKIDSTKNVEISKNHNLYCKKDDIYGLINKQLPTNTMIAMSPASPQNQTQTQRTEDQNNAYRHIESVHNYAKSKSYEGDDDDNSSANDSRQSSYLDDDDDEDDDEEEDNGDDDIGTFYDNDDIDYKKSNVDDLDAEFEDIVSRQRLKRFPKLCASSDGGLSIRTNSSRGAIIENMKKPAQFVNILKDHKLTALKIDHSYKVKDSKQDEDEVHIDVDVETVESQFSPTPALCANSCVANNIIGDKSTAYVKPDHHARRPMNAFLIFCKRHRAIVKERYKNLENRAITKILGDWWASLDTNDKICFTNLAQQNKDAFFSANPNFKWYKLPAPPLRTLTTRPANAFGHEFQETYESNTMEIISNTTRSNNSNYFKLADEAQMGDLSQLMQEKSKTTKQCTDLQQALGETSQFMSAHITGNAELIDENPLKRRIDNENSFSSNSSEEDNLESKKKSARSCKGKIYQELINSGQIATAVKKSKSSTRFAGGNSNNGTDNSAETNIKQNFLNVNNFINNNNPTYSICQKLSVSESENMMSYDLSGFDLEERIKELPALNLDDYLQRKRNTKKKKKFSSSGKKKAQRNNTQINNNKHNNVNLNLQQVEVAAASNKRLQQQQQKAVIAAVGSQKRKARKESITRRDVSAIEQEVASLLPLTINGCCYFQEAPTTSKLIRPIEKDTETDTITTQSSNVTSTSPIIPLQQNSSSSVSIDILNNTNIRNNKNTILNDNISSSTSDLLILAEVAANRTELKH